MVLTIIVALLTAGSILGALSTSLPTFIIARVLQGRRSRDTTRDRVTTHQPATSTDTFRHRHRLGHTRRRQWHRPPPSRSDLRPHPRLRPLFWIITALSVLAFVLALTCIPSAEAHRTGRLDVPGAILLSSALCGSSCLPSVKALTGAGDQWRP